VIDDAARLEAMLDAIRRIHGYVVVRGRGQFFSDYDTQRLILVQIGYLGESADRISKSFKKANPEVPWTDLKDLRTLVIHDYESIALPNVWAFVTDRLPKVERQLRRAGAPRRRYDVD
jgi:uncharacterized protein with HEPN domain